MANEQDRNSISVRLTAAQKSKLRAIAKRHKVEMSVLTRNALEIGLPAAERGLEAKKAAEAKAAKEAVAAA